MGNTMEEFDRVHDRWTFALREAGLLVFSLLAAWLLVNHRAFFVFPPNLAHAEGATWQTYLFLAILVDAALHVAFLLLWPGPSERGSRVPRVEPGDFELGVVRNEAARRPARAALAESRPRAVESALGLRRAFAAAERSWSDTVVQDYIDDLTSILDADNPPAHLPEPAPPDDGRLRPVRVVRRVMRVVRPEPRSFETTGPDDVPAGDRTRPGERNQPPP